MMKFKLLIWLILWVPLISTGQSKFNIDSLHTALKLAKDDQTRCIILNNLAISYIRQDVNRALGYNRQAMDLAIKTRNKSQIAVSYSDISEIYKVKGEYDQALDAITKARLIYLELKDTNAVGETYSQTGNIYNLKNEPRNALLNLLEAERLYTLTGKIEGEAKLFNSLGSLYLIMKQYDKALESYEKSQKINDKEGFKLGSSVNLLNIGSVFQAKKEYTTAILYMEKALKIKEEINDNLGIQRCLNNIGTCYINNGMTDKAIYYHERSLKSAQEAGNQIAIAMTYVNLGYDYQQAGKYEKAIQYSKTGLSMAEKAGELKLQTEATRVLNETYAKTGDHIQAYQYLLLHKRYSDSLEKKQSREAVSEIQSKYDVVKKDNEIKELNINNTAQELKLQSFRQRNSFFILLIVCGAVIVIFLYYQSHNRRKINKKLQEINDLKSHFFANLSHEFRTPITLMLGPVEKLLENALPQDIAMLQIIQRNAKRLLSLDEQLLEFTRIDSGNQRIMLSYGDVFLPVKAITEAYELFAIKKGLNFTAAIPDEKSEAYFDPDILEKVAGNLLTNAFKYTPTGGHVICSASMVNMEKDSESLIKWNAIAGRYFRFSVEDTGIGIPASKTEKIFERFYQLNNNQGNSNDGAGIGLAMTRELLKLHHGWIELLSTEGKGSIFTIFIPADKEAFTSEELKQIRNFEKKEILSYPADTKIHAPSEYTTFPTENLTVGETGNQGHILIVDDNTDMRLYISEILRPFFTVSEAPNGKEGLILATELIPDLVITDVMMQSMDGMELCRLLKNDKKTDSIPVIMLTALTDQEDRLRGLETGADDYITKPFSSQELLIRLKNLIIQREKLKKLFTNELKIEAQSVSITSSDAKLLQSIIAVVEKNIDNPDMDVNMIIREMAISRTQLHRKLTSLTNQSVTGFIKVIRMKRAAQLIEQKAGNITEVMYSVGYDNLSYFSKCFREVYSMSPREYLENVKI